jgi:hypothetical protein
MEHQTEGLGLRPPNIAEERTSGTADDTASVTAADSAGGDREEDAAGYCAEGAEPDASRELPDETDERRPATGEPRVDAALARLDELEGLPVTGHRAVFEDVHRRLKDVLDELDSGQPGEAGHPAGAPSRPGP